MSSNGVPLVALNNPAVFMTKEYLEKIFLKDKYSKGEIIPIIKNEVQILTVIKFPEEALVDEFISEFNNKPISTEFNFILSLTKTNKIVENGIRSG